MHQRTHVFSALSLARHAASTVADPMASHAGLGGAVLLIEGARTHDPGISTGAVAVFRAFSTRSPAAFAGRAAPRASAQRSFACS